MRFSRACLLSKPDGRPPRTRALHTLPAYGRSNECAGGYKFDTSPLRCDQTAPCVFLGFVFFKAKAPPFLLMVNCTKARPRRAFGKRPLLCTSPTLSKLGKKKTR